jgi:uncharacterized membrane protein YhaH (DUF805 family)
VFFVIVVLAIIGLMSLLGVTVSTALGALGALIIIPIVLFKLALVAVFLGFVFGGRRRWHGHGRRWERRWERPEPPRQSAEDRFEEWHRMAHARDEVDSWAPEV